MSSRPEILVTGATGTVGRQVVAQLLDGGHGARALVRDPAAAALPDHVELAVGDLSHPGPRTPCATGPAGTPTVSAEP